LTFEADFDYLDSIANALVKEACQGWAFYDNLPHNLFQFLNTMASIFVNLPVNTKYVSVSYIWTSCRLLYVYHIYEEVV
jgi:hypothetical protein